VEALPVAEILFQDFPEGMPKILGYEAKWDEDSFACINTVRHFPEDPEDDGLLGKVREAALSAWHLCGLEGYARIDLRLDEAGEPRVLEVNANPCLAADAGFMAAAAKAGLSGKEVVRRILAAVRKGKEEGDLTIRQGLEAADRAPLEAVIRGTGFFNPEEIEVAIELIDDRLSLGEESHYRFLVAERDGQVAGYACWGPIPGTAASVDLYWIVVHPERQGQGIGAALLRAAEEWVVSSGRNRVYVETSTRGSATRPATSVVAIVPEGLALPFFTPAPMAR
jgi:ribosomal protein S18 acetylase RimI-like enzyme